MKRDTGIEVNKVGPLKAWRLDCEGSSARLCVETPLAEYICCQPAPVFKKVFVHLKDRADVAFEVRFEGFLTHRLQLGSSSPLPCFLHVAI